MSRDLHSMRGLHRQDTRAGMGDRRARRGRVHHAVKQALGRPGVARTSR